MRAHQSALTATIAEQNREIDSMLGEVSELRRKQAAAAAELEEKQAELDAATAALEKEEAHLEAVRKKLQRALGVLRQRLVSIYESGSPDVVNAILESEDWSQMAAQTEYLSRIQSYDDEVVERVKTLRDEVRAAVDRLTEKRGRDRSSARRGRRDRARSRRRPQGSRGALRRTEGGAGAAPRSAGSAGSRAKKRSATTSPRSPNRSPPKAADGDHRPDAGAAQPR